MSASNHSSDASQQPPGNKPVGIDFNDPEWRAIEPGEESMSRPLQLTSLIACAELRQVIEKDHLVFEDRSNQKELRRIDDFLKIIKRDLRSDSTTQQALRSGVYFARHDFKATDIYRDCFKLGSKKKQGEPAFSLGHATSVRGGNAQVPESRRRPGGHDG